MEVVEGKFVRIDFGKEQDSEGVRIGYGAIYLISLDYKTDIIQCQE